ncbi:ComEA family DNA-binding protein [Candidatus Omnitrophota bacterium]
MLLFIGSVALVGIGLTVVSKTSLDLEDTVKQISLRRARNKADVNSASLVELVRVKHITPFKAHRIIKHREENGPFENKQELNAFLQLSKRAREDLEKTILVK